MWTSWISLVFAALIYRKPSCRCLYGEPCWPRPSEFVQFASRLSQPLLFPRPSASPCYAGPAANSSKDCANALSNAHNGTWRSSQPGSAEIANFESYIFDNGTISACYMDTTLGFPCGQGNIPAIGVDARGVWDVQAAVSFAVQHNLRLVVKNTGHDLLGRSTARGAFLLWVHNMKEVTYRSIFLPDGAPQGKTYKHTLTFGAGVQWFEAFAAAERFNRVLVGGFSRDGSVGAAGGWVQGGGHSAFAPKYGLGVDNVIQFTVVTSTGAFLNANAYQNSDLFWALRGGGGGTYAIVISATYKTHEVVPISSVIFSAKFSSPQTAKTVLTEYVKTVPQLTDQGWGGYASVSSDALRFLYNVPNTSIATANATLQPFLKLSQHITSGQTETNWTSYSSFGAWNAIAWDLFEAAFHSSGDPLVGLNLEMASRLCSRELAENDPGKVVDVMMAIGGDVAMASVAGGAVAKKDPDAMGLHPGWRKAAFFVFTFERWLDGAPASFIRKAHQRIRSKLDILDGLASESATYLNEASLYEKDFKRSFFGAHYDRLKHIKEKYDPIGLFVVPKGVGSEDWDEELHCRW